MYTGFDTVENRCNASQQQYGGIESGSGCTGPHQTLQKRNGRLFDVGTDGQSHTAPAFSQGILGTIGLGAMLPVDRTAG